MGDLIEADQWFQPIVESLPSGLLLVDEDGRIALVNRQAESLFGYSREELRGQAVEVLVPEPLREAQCRVVRDHLQAPGLQPWQCAREIRGLRKDGRLLDLQLVFHPLHHEGRLLILVTVFDVTERKRARDLVESVVEYLPDGTVMVDRDGRIVLVNQETARMFGFARGELLGQSLDVLIPERYHAHHHGLAARFLAERRQRSMNEGRDLWARRKDGTVFPVDISLHSFERHGESFAVASIRDMTERHRLREEIETNLSIQNVTRQILQTSLEPISLEEHLKRTLDLILSIPWFSREAKGGIFLVDDDPDTLVLKANHNLPGKVTDACATVPMGYCLCGQAAQRRESVFSDDLASRHEYRYEGQPRHGHYCVPIQSEERLYGVINVLLSDPAHARRPEEESFLASVARVLAGTIERKRAEEALRRSEERFDLAIRGTDAGIWDWDLRTNEVFYSARWKSMLGYAEHEIRNEFSEWEARLHPEERERAQKAVEDYLAGRSAEYELEHRLRHKDGTYRWILSRGAAVRDRAGRPFRIVGSHLDISVHKQTAAQLNENLIQLQSAQKIQEALLPKRSPSLAGLDIAGISYPAAFAGGDMYDYLDLMGGNLGIVIGDVSGHGIAAALLMTATQAFLRSLAHTCSTLGEMMTRVNQYVADETEGDSFVTLALIRFDPRTRTVTYANAGHPPGLVLSPDGHVRRELTSNALPLGIIRYADFPVPDPVVLFPGEILVLVTDGILEAVSPEEEPFDSEGMLEVIRAARGRPAAEILDALYRAVVRHTGTEVSRDDLTAVVMKLDP